MKYYIVVIEWNYPTESGRDIIDDYDTLEEAREAAKEQYENEFQNFKEVNDGNIYMAACGETVDRHTQECTGFVLNSSEYEDENMWFRSRIITVEHGQYDE